MSSQKSNEDELLPPPPVDKRADGEDEADDDGSDESCSNIEADVKPPVYRQKLMAAQLMDEARCAIKNDQDFGVTAEERLLENKLTIDDINAAIAGIDEWHKKRLLQQQKRLYDEDKEDDKQSNPETGPESETGASPVDDGKIQREMKRYTPSEKQILQLQSLEELTKSPFNYLPLNCLDKYSALFSKVKTTANTSTPGNSPPSRLQSNNIKEEEEERGPIIKSTTTTSTLLSTVFVGLNIKDTMSKRRVEGLFHEYLLENEMYRIQQESRQGGFLESMAQERQMMAAEADMSHGVDSLRSQLMDFSKDLDFLLDGPSITSTTAAATAATAAAAAASTSVTAKAETHHGTRTRTSSCSKHAL